MTSHVRNEEIRVERVFEHGQYGNYQIIRCSKCSNKVAFSVTTSVGMPPDIITKKARYVGWDVATNKLKHAICPDCQHRKETRVVTLKTAAEPPPQPTKEQNRLIFLAIENAYSGPDKGYIAGKTDQTVADELKVPRAWVAFIRDQFFGPLLNEQWAAKAVQMREELLKLGEQVVALDKKLSAFLNELKGER